MLVSPAMNAALREARFDGDGPLDRAGEQRARAAAGAIPAAGRYASGPSERCLRTTEALGLAVRPEPDLADWDLGRWRGLRLDEVAAREPEAVAEWLGDPVAAPHGGESLRDLTARVGGWLAAQAQAQAQAGAQAEAQAEAEAEAEGNDSVLAVAGPSVVRAAVVHGLALPMAAFWRLDVAPLSLTELSGRSGRWNVRLGQPLTARDS
ncbi:histidine phosphatase family protein [Streptomyces sp. NBC_01433]|uniref:histidine phosphatase family protein n=1 Tax=Streptomyces sp. NBC_01433 TaxID=2903864 RepID=UPI00224EBE67|nr:histidine phosphatase family protein [Streptomyces sp. NBC_01433]MCX4679710.1 histidine phosphatase family protein [Streptomyces sp. NBC_01433]